MSGSGYAPPIPTQPYELFVKQQRDLERSRQGNGDDDIDGDDGIALVRGGPGFTTGGARGGGGGSMDSSLDRADRSMQFGRLGDLDTNSFHAVSIDTPLSSNNPGFRMLVKMGWAAGTGLGSRSQGRVDPVALAPACSKLGLGKLEADLGKAKDATETRRLLESEILEQLDATSAAELESKWKAKAERKDAIAAEVREVTKVFFCEPCRKQYKTVSEFDNHLSSYDHHHTLRLKDLRERERKQKQGRSGDGKKRDRREAERELERISKMASSKADVQAGSQPPLAGARSSAGTSGAGQAVPPPRPPAPSGSSTAPQQTLGGWSSMPVGTSSASRQPDRTTPTAGGWTQAAPAERATPTASGWMQAAPAEDDAAAASAAAKQEERRRKLEAWKAAQSSVTPITQASIKPPPSSSGFGFAQRGTQQSSMPSASAGPVSATGTATATNDQRTRVTAAPARPTAVMAAFGGGSSDEDDAPEEAPQQKKHRALWQPT